jgi:RHS repeat-associated protein
MSGAGLHKSTFETDSGVTLRTFGYDQGKNLISIADQFGCQTTIQRDDAGTPLSITSPDGITTNLTVNANNHLMRITYPDGSYHRFEYTADGLATAKIQPEGNRFDHVFDINGRITDFTDEQAGHWQFLRSVDASGNIMTEVLTGEGNVSSYMDYTDSTGAFTSTMSSPSNAKTLLVRSDDGLLERTSLPCGTDFEFMFGTDPEYRSKFLKQTRETSPSGLQKITLMAKTYQDINLDGTPDVITETATVNGKPAILENNVLQAEKTIASPEGRTATAVYDPVTLLTLAVSVPGLYDTSYGYDARGRLTSVHTNTRGIHITYNVQGFPESITDSENHVTHYTYDEVGRVKCVDRPDNTSLWFSYDKNGNMTILTNPLNIDHVFGYNAVNQNTTYQTPLSGSYGYVYDKDRRLTQINFPSGNHIKNIYDATQLTQIQAPEGNIDITYLFGSHVHSVTKGSEAVTYGYDGRLLTSETLSGTLNQVLSYSYNNDFNPQSFTYAGNTHAYIYDNDGLLTGSGDFAIARNAGNGLPDSITGGALKITRTFNGYGEVEVQDVSISGQSLSSWALARDNSGRIVNKTEAVGGGVSGYVYTYDAMGRLEAVTKDGTPVEQYQYGPNGTRTYEMNALRGTSGRGFDYSDEDHLLTAGDCSYQYDLDGFLTTKTCGSDVTQYDYSSRGELLRVTLPDGMFIEYIYDPLGRRIAKKINGITVYKYLWQGLSRLLAVYDDSNTLLMRFEYADARMPVAMTRDGATYYLMCDQVGSLRLVADASGNVLKKIDYDTFGNIIDDTDESFEMPFGFAGGLRDRHTGLVWFGFRDYDPDIGRWTAKDPILFAGGDADLYGYCLNDPLNWIDPWGLSQEVSDYVKWLKTQGVDRNVNDPYIHKLLYDSKEGVPDYIRTYEPADWWGRIVDDWGSHMWNQRLPGGYHLHIDYENGPVYVHQDACDPLQGRKEAYEHIRYEHMTPHPVIIRQPVRLPRAPL